MSTAWYVGRSEIRRRRALVVLVLLIGLTSGAVLATAAGARRSASAVDRYLDATLANDGALALQTTEYNAFALRRVLEFAASQPEVEYVAAFWGAPTGMFDDDGQFVAMEVAFGGRGASRHRTVTEGRAPDPAVADEVAISPALADYASIGPGDEIEVPTWEPDVLRDWLRNGDRRPVFTGPRLHLRVVGVVEGFEDFTLGRESLLIVGTPALLERWGSQIGTTSGGSVGYRLHRPADASDVDAFNARASAEAPDPVVGYLAAAGTARVDDAIHAQAVALAIAATVAGAVAIVVIGSAIHREVQAATESTAPLRAIGVDPIQAGLARAMPALVAVAAGTAISLAVAVALSPRFPTGLARRVEPDPGLAVDPLVLVAGGAGIVLVAGWWCLLTARAAERAQLRPRLPGRRPLRSRRQWGGSVVRSGDRWAAAGLGVVVATALATAGVMAVAAVGHAVQTATTQPERWGWTWSTTPAIDAPDEESFNAAVEATERDHPVEVDVVGWVTVELDGSAELLVGFQDAPTDVAVLDGRLPGADDEIALGPRTARALGASIGDEVEVVDGAGTREVLTVVGELVTPLLEVNDSTGTGALVTWHHLGELRGNNTGTVVTLTYGNGVDVDTLEQQLEAEGWHFGDDSRPFQPGPVANTAQLRPVLVWLAAFFAVLGVVRLGLGLRSGAWRRREVATLRAIGFRRRDVRRAAVVEACLLLVRGGLVGGLVGAVLGSRIVARIASDLGIAPLPSHAMLHVALISAASLLVAAVLGWWAGGHAYRRARTLVTSAS